MSKNYDNWERLVDAVLRREQDKQLALSHSRDASSIGSPSSSTNSSFSYISNTSRFDHDIDHNQHSPVHTQRSKVPMDFSDLILSHVEWKAMLPPGKNEVVFKSASLGFFLDHTTAKNCFILGAKKLLLPDELLWSGDSFDRWKCKAHLRPRFSEVAKIVGTSVCYHIQARIHAEMLSPKTSYAAYVVFGTIWNFKNSKSSARSILTLSHDGALRDERQVRIVHFGSGIGRADGWMEVEMGRFYIRHGKNAKALAELQRRGEYGTVDNSLIIEGIEFRPLIT